MVTTLYALYMTTGCYYEMSSDSIPGAGVSVTGLVVACQLEAAQLIAWRTLEPSDWVVIEETLRGFKTHYYYYYTVLICLTGKIHAEGTG